MTTQAHTGIIAVRRPLPMRAEESTEEVRIRSFHFLRGPNVYAYMPVMHAVLDAGSYADRPSTAFPGFVERLGTWLPGLARHECSLKRPGGFIERLMTIADRFRPDPSTEAIISAARRRNIPILRVTPRGSLYQLG